MTPDGIESACSEPIRVSALAVTLECFRTAVLRSAPDLSEMKQGFLTLELAGWLV